MDLDAFFSKQNLRYYRRLLQPSITPRERSAIIATLATGIVATRKSKRTDQTVAQAIELNPMGRAPCRCLLRS